MISAKTIKKTALAPTALITHGGGFLSAHLAQTLLLRNCRVIVLSDFSRHRDDRLKSLLKSPKFALFDCDIAISLPDVIDSVDYIFHLANYDTLITAEDAPDLEGLLSAGVGTKHLLDLAKKSQAKFALVLLVNSKLKARSTGWVEENEIGIDDAQKYAQSLTTQYRERYELDARFVYLGRVYGAHMDLSQSGELGSLLTDILEDRALKVYNDGVRKEFYTFYTDAVSGLVKSLFSPNVGGSYTLVEQNPHTSLEVAYLLRSLATGKLDIEFAPSGKVYADPVLRELSYPPAWSPKVELKDGLIKTLKAFGYKPNTKAFKAAALLENREKEAVVGDNATASISGSSAGADQGAKGVLQGDSGEQAFGAQVSREATIRPTLPEEPKINPIKLVWYRTERLIRNLGRRLENRGVGRAKIISKIKLVLSAVLGVFALAGVLTGVPLVQSYNHAKGALSALENYQVSISQLDAQKSQKFSESAYKRLVKLENSLNRAAFLFKLAGKDKELGSLRAFAESAKNFSSALYSLSLGAEPFSNLWEGLKPNGNPNYSLDEFTRAAPYFLDAKQKLDFAKASAFSVDVGSFPAGVRGDFERYVNVLDKLTESSDFLTQLALEFPSIMGFDGQKRYLILFQNNNEIRPTGGFLGSYADVEIKDGKIVSISIDDIYNPDGQLKLRRSNESIKSPTPLLRALGEESLFIRNANWDPSFPQSVATITRLFKLVDDRVYNGVFAVDLYFVRGLLSVTGPVYLTAYEEEIKVENMYERVQFHSDFDFQEGVSAKKAFLTVLGGKILERLFALPREKIPALGNVLYSSLEQKHLVVYLPDSYLNAYLAERGWDGSLLKSDGDYLYVVNANLGGTKSNYYVKNSMNYAVSAKTSDGLLRGELELTYENTQKDASWPGGPYTNYVRVLVAEGSKLTGAFLIGGQEEAQLSRANKENYEAKKVAREVQKTASESMDVSNYYDSSSPVGGDKVEGATSGTGIFDDVVISRVGNYTSFEYQIKVYPQEKVKLLFTYDLPQSLSAKKGENVYKLIWQKQPGTQNDAIRFIFAAPFGTEISAASPTSVVAENVYEHRSVLNSDLRFSLSYK